MILIWILAFVLTITIHEAAHAWMSDRLGDPTARVLGRLTLNPIKHLDLYGTVLIPLFLLLVHSPFVFGWAKPVPIDPYNLKNPRRDSALISLAGPLINIAFATVLAILVRLIPDATLFNIAYPIILLNVTIAVFNLIPVHPLDGGKILVGVLPNTEARELDAFLSRYGFMVLIFLIFPIFGGSSLLTSIISPVINFIMFLLVPGSSFI